MQTAVSYLSLPVRNGCTQTCLKRTVACDQANLHVRLSIQAHLSIQHMYASMAIQCRVLWRAPGYTDRLVQVDQLLAAAARVTAQLLLRSDNP